MNSARLSALKTIVLVKTIWYRTLLLRIRGYRIEQSPDGSRCGPLDNGIEISVFGRC